MYLKEKLIKSLKVKNVLFNIFAAFCIASSAAVLISLFAHYSDDLETFISAKAFPECVRNIFLGIVLLIISGFSRKFIGDASFYSGYFENNLDGFVKYDDLAEITGKNKYLTKFRLYCFRKIYMKRFTVNLFDNSDCVVLESKKYICECAYCGANIEKSVYFTGVCEYCGNSDLKARVITDGHFYSIKSEMSTLGRNPDYFTAKNALIKSVLLTVCLIIGICVAAVCSIAIIDNISKYNDSDYLREVLLSGKSYSSYKLIKAEIMDTIIFFVFIMLAFLPLAVLSAIRLFSLNIALNCSKQFALSKHPFINIDKLTIPAKSRKRRIGIVRKALRRRYLKNCTFEMHGNTLNIALAKKTVKDKCPTCGASIVGAIDENYRCAWCKNTIFGVIEKK